MNQTLLVIGLLLIVAGVVVYNYAGEELIKERSNLNWLKSSYAQTAGELQSIQNLGIAISVIGFLFGLAGAMERGESKT